MTELTLPTDLVLALSAANEPVRLVDSQGNVIGIATRTSPPQELNAADFAEALRRAKSPVRGRPLSETLADLESLGQK